MRGMTKAVDTVRKQEHREFLRTGDGSPLTGTKYVWLFSDERRPDYHAETFATLQALNLKVGRAWAIKEALRTLWTYRCRFRFKNRHRSGIRTDTASGRLRGTTRRTTCREEGCWTSWNGVQSRF